MIDKKVDILLRKVSTPFFVVNPKNFLHGEELIDLAKKADYLSGKFDIDVFFTTPPTELKRIVDASSNLIVTSQHMDYQEVGNSMGKIIAEELHDIGVQAVVLNHAESQLTVSHLLKSIDKAKEADLLTIVCASSIKETELIAMASPDIVLAEPTELIGQNKKSNKEYVQLSVNAVKSIDSNILVEQGAGIRSEKDVIELLKFGADGIGVTSGIVKSEKPKQSMESMIKATYNFKEGKLK